MLQKNSIYLDPITKAAMALSYEHHEIHGGNHFFVADFEVMGSAQEADFVITTPDTLKWAHMTFAINSTDGGSMEIYRGVTHDDDGVKATPINNNENSSNTSDLIVQRDPTINTLGTKIYGNSSGERGAIGIIEREREIMLRQNTEYLFRITSLTGTNTVSYCGSWYEHINK